MKSMRFRILYQAMTRCSPADLGRGASVAWKPPQPAASVLRPRAMHSRASVMVRRVLSCRALSREAGPLFSPSRSLGAAAAAPLASSPQLKLSSEAQQLLRAISQCRTPEEVRFLAADQQQQLSRGKGLEEEEGNQHLQQELLPAVATELQVSLAKGLDQLSAAQVLKVLVFMGASLPSKDSQTLYAQAVPFLYNSLGALTHSELVTLVSAYSAAGAYNQELYTALSEFLWESLSELEPAQVAEVAWAYGVVGHYDDDEDMFNELAAKAVEQLEAYSPQALAKLVWSLGKLRFRHEALCSAALRQMNSHCDAWPLSCSGQLLWGLAQVQHSAEGELLNSVARSLGVKLLNLRTSTDGQMIGRGKKMPVGSRLRGGGAAAPEGQPPTQDQSGSSCTAAASTSSSSSSSGGPGGQVAGSSSSSEGQQGSAAEPSLRPLVETGPLLQEGLTTMGWGLAMLSQSLSAEATSLFRDCLKMLGAFDTEEYTDEQLALMWETHLRVLELNHPLFDPHPLLSDSYKVYSTQISRPASRTLSLPQTVQTLAAAEWLQSSIHREEGASSSSSKGGTSDEQQQQQQQQGFSSWRYRDPQVLTRAALVQSVGKALMALPSLGRPMAQITLDGCYVVPLACKHKGLHLAWEVLPPSWCCRNPPHAPIGPTTARLKGLKYRGYAVLQVPFYEWHDVITSVDPKAAAEQYLTGKVARALPQHTPVIF